MLAARPGVLPACNDEMRRLSQADGASGYLSGNAEDRMVALGEACSEFAVALDCACFELATNVGQLSSYLHLTHRLLSHKAWCTQCGEYKCSPRINSEPSTKEA